MMPRIRITELLHEVARETGFMTAFTNLRTGETCPNENALLAAILADATNLGLSRMAAASQGVTRDQLAVAPHRADCQAMLGIRERDINARYGVDPGFSFYTHVSDQHGPYHVKVISAATHEA